MKKNNIVCFLRIRYYDHSSLEIEKFRVHFSSNRYHPPEVEVKNSPSRETLPTTQLPAT